MDERRVQQRYPMQLRVELRVVGSAEELVQVGETRDVSSTGFYLVGVPDSLEEGSRVQLALWLPAGDEGQQAGLRGLGRVVRVERRANDGNGVAVKFERVELERTDLESIT